MKIEFYPSSKEVELLVPPPKPAAYYIPDWYKRIPKFSEKNVNILDLAEEGPNVKSCPPFADAMMTGYIQETWQDIVIGFKDGQLALNFTTTPEIAGSRGDRIDLPIQKDFYQNEFVWRTPWIPKLPDGWSMLFMSPLNHVELPFVTVSGVMDSDKFYHVPNGNFPFYIKSGFTGVIPAGTPMFQMIPIKRESWESSIQEWDEEAQTKRQHEVRKKAFGGYKRFFHVRKSYL